MFQLDENGVREASLRVSNWHRILLNTCKILCFYFRFEMKSETARERSPLDQGYIQNSFVKNQSNARQILFQEKIFFIIYKGTSREGTFKKVYHPIPCPYHNIPFENNFRSPHYNRQEHM